MPRTGGFSDGPTEGEVVLQEMKATEKRALVGFLTKQSLLGFLALPKGGGPETSHSPSSPGTTHCRLPGVTFRTLTRLPLLPLPCSLPGLLTSGSHFLVFST